MSAHLRLTQAALVGCLAVALWGTFGLMATNGTIELMQTFSKEGPHILPGTSAPLKQVYTGIGPIDYQLTVLTLFFWTLKDASHPEYALHSFDFAFQFCVQYGVLVIEGSRPGNVGKIVSYVAVFGGLAQNYAIANTLPIFFLAYLATSPTVHAASLSTILPSTADLVSLPFSLLLGYWVPVAFMSNSTLSYEAQQNWIATWQAFPLWVAIFQQVLPIIVRPFVERGTGRENVDENVEYLRTTYTFLKYLSTFGQIASWSLSFKTLESPKLFAAGIPEALHPWNVWAPLDIRNTFKAPDIGTGANMFLQYDKILSSASIVIWAYYMYSQTNIKKDSGLGATVWSILKTAATVAFIGPAGAAVALIEARDEKVLAQAGAGRKKVI